MSEDKTLSASENVPEKNEPFIIRSRIEETINNNCRKYVYAHPSERVKELSEKIRPMEDEYNRLMNDGKDFTEIQKKLAPFYSEIERERYSEMKKLAMREILAYRESTHSGDFADWSKPLENAVDAAHSAAEEAFDIAEEAQAAAEEAQASVEELTSRIEELAGQIAELESRLDSIE
ncbi:MAG: hypothetical protein LBL25_01610 [Oscillospiraceae bacterium]|jgi:DNA repair exonuclease SbcCD ATPase subunit|nr:hypothetical protein [Oscillospiraceae bacterium]